MIAPWLEDEDKEKPAPKDDARKAAADQPPQERRRRGMGIPSITDFGKSLAGGFLGSVESGLEGIDWLGDKLGIKGTSAEEAAAALRKFREERLTPEVSNIFTDVVAGVGSLAAFFVPGGLAARVPIFLARAAKGAEVSAAAMRWAQYAGIGASSALEALAEAGSVYREVIDSGKSEEVASDAASRTFFKNMALLGVTNKLSGFFEVGGKSLRRALTRGFVFEGAQEAGQSAISQSEVKGDIDWGEAAYEGLVGGIVGGGVGGIVAKFDRDRLKAERTPGGGVQIVDAEDLNAGLTADQRREQLEEKARIDRIAALAEWAQQEIKMDDLQHAEEAERALIEKQDQLRQQKAVQEAETQAETNRLFVDSISTRAGVMDVAGRMVGELEASKDPGMKRIARTLRQVHRDLWMGDASTTGLKERLYEIEQIEQKIPDQYLSMVASRLKDELVNELSVAQRREQMLERRADEEAEEGISRARQYQRVQAAVDDATASENLRREQEFDRRAAETRARLRRHERRPAGAFGVPRRTTTAATTAEEQAAPENFVREMYRDLESERAAEENRQRLASEESSRYGEVLRRAQENERELARRRLERERSEIRERLRSRYGRPAEVAATQEETPPGVAATQEEIPAEVAQAPAEGTAVTPESEKGTPGTVTAGAETQGAATPVAGTPSPAIEGAPPAAEPQVAGAAAPAVKVRGRPKSTVPVVSTREKLGRIYGNKESAKRAIRKHPGLAPETHRPVQTEAGWTVVEKPEEEKGKAKYSRRSSGERVQAAAIRTPDGRVITGVSHGFIMLDNPWLDGFASLEDGFVTNEGRFVTRGEAARLHDDIGRDVAISEDFAHLDSMIRAREAQIAKTDPPAYSKYQELRGRFSKGAPVEAADRLAMVRDTVRTLQLHAPKALKTRVVATQAELPPSLRPADSTNVVVEAVTSPEGVVYLVAENIHTKKQVIEKWMHEQVGHHGLRNFMESVGVDYNQFLDWAHRVVKNDSIYKWVEKNYADDTAGMSAKEAARFYTEEVLARRSERLSPTKRNLIWDRIRTLLNRFLKAIHLKEGDPEREPVYLDKKSIDVIIEGAYRYISNEHLRQWNEFVHSDETYKQWFREIVEKYPDALTWYENHQAVVNEVFGDDAPIFNALLSLTSVQAPVRENTIWAIESYLHMLGDPKHKLPGGIFPKSNMEKIQLFTGDKEGFINAILSSDRVKVSEFLRGLLGDRMATVNDRWMYRIFYGDHLLRPNLLKERLVRDPKTGKMVDISKDARAGIESVFSAEENVSARHKLFQLAKELSEEYGKPIYPRDVQAALWMYFSSREQGITPNQQWDYVKALNTPVSMGFIKKWGLDKSKWTGPKSNVKWYVPEAFKAMPQSADLFTGKAPETLTPLQYLKMRMEEIGAKPGDLSQRLNVGKMGEVSRLEEQYRTFLEKKGIERVFSKKRPGAVHPLELGKGVHYRGVSLRRGDFLRPSGVKQNQDYSVYSASDIGNRIQASTARNPYAPLVYFYEAGTKPETQLRSKPNRYNVDFAKYDIYDAIKDELGLYAQARKEPEIDKGASETNALARLVKEHGFDGFLVKNPYGPGRWVLMNKETAVDFAPADMLLGVSDVVESVETLPQDVRQLERMLGPRGAAFERRIRKMLKEYLPEVILDRLQPGIARFPVATSDIMEIGGILRLRGPLPAIRAAAAMIGLQNSQRQIYVMHNADESGPPNGKFFRYKVRREYRTVEEVYEKVRAAEIPEFNITVNPFSGSIWVEQYVWTGEEGADNAERVERLSKLMDELMDPNFPHNEVFDIRSDILGDQSDTITPEAKELARANYLEHLQDYFGQTRGKQIYEQGVEQSRRHEEELVRRATGEEGIQEGQMPGGLRPGDHPRFSKQLSPRQKEILDHIGVNAPTESVAERGARLEMSWWDKIMTNVVDSLHPIRRLEEAVAGKDLPVYESGRKSFSLLTNFPNMFRSILYDGTPRMEGGWMTVVPEKEGGLLTLVESLGDQAQDFFLWMTGISAEEMRSKGQRQHLFGKNQNTGEYFDDAEVIETIREATREQYLANKPRWDAARERLRAINRSILDFAEASGLISKEARQGWERADYIPFYRVLRDDWVDASPEENIRAMFPKGGVPHIGTIHRLKGSALNVGDPMVNLVNSYAFLMHESLKNLARSRVLKHAEAGGFLRPASPKGGKNVIAVRHNGKAVYYQVSDPLLYDAMTEMESMTGGKLSAAMRVLSTPKRILTAGVTATPTFMVANFLRDTLQTTAMQKSFIPIVDSFRGLVHAWRRTDKFKEFVSSGGAFGGAYHQRDVGPKDHAGIERLRKELRRGGKSGNYALRLWDKWLKVGEAFENAARMGAYLRGVDSGMSKADAAYFAKDLLDFHRHGKAAFVQFAIRTIPFLNARIQGIDRLARGFTDPKNRRKFYTTALILTLASIMLHAENDGEDWYDDLPQYEHAAYWHIPIPGAGRLRIPKPFEFGALFGALPEALLKHDSGVWDDQQLGEFVQIMITQVFSVDFPQVIKPFIVQFANKDPFTGAPIVPRGEEKLEGPMQFGARTSKLARKLAEYMPEGFDSPRRIDKFTDDVFGASAYLVRSVIDATIMPFIENYPEDPAERASDHWLFGRFYRDGDAPDRASLAQQKFYRLLNESDQAMATLREYQKLQDPEKYREYLEKNRDKIARSKFLTEAQKAVGVINQKIKLVHRSSKLDRWEKRDKIDELLEQRGRIFRAAIDKLSS